MTHYLKTLPEYFESVLSGKKSFEVRKDDRNPQFAPGDKLILQEYMISKTVDDVLTGIYTGRVIHADVLLVLRGEYCRDGYCIMSIVPTYAVNAKFEAVTEIARLKAENAILRKALEKSCIELQCVKNCRYCNVKLCYGPGHCDKDHYEYFIQQAKEDLDHAK